VFYLSGDFFSLIVALTLTLFCLSGFLSKSLLKISFYWAGRIVMVGVYTKISEDSFTSSVQSSSVML
jgi:hypothetical protein